MNRLVTEQAPDKTLNYQYDSYGNRSQLSVTGDEAYTTSYTYDKNNRLRKQTKAAGSASEITDFWYDPNGNQISSKTGNNESFYTYNGHGDVVQLTGGNGSITKQYSYDAFGVEKDKAENDTNPFRYCGEYYDTETDSVYLRARYYTPATGRFITEDPIKDGLNWYVYGNGNPVIEIDPSGLDSYIIYTYDTISGDGQHTFYDEAMIRKQQLEADGRINVHLFGVASAKDFEKIWNTRVGYDMDGYDVPIEDVIIIAHGSIEGEKDNDTAQSYLYFEDGYRVKTKLYAKYNAGGDADVAVSNLAWKQMNWLTFSACNTGNPDVYNLAYAFKIRMTIKFIVAWDGGTIFDYNTNQLMKGGPHSWQGTWYNYVDKNVFGWPKRERIGYRLIEG